MSDDRLAGAVGEVMREDEETLDPRLERLARGELSESERRELDEAAKSDPELARAVELHAPLSPELRGRLVREIARPRAKVIVLRRIAAAGALAAAAALGALWIRGDAVPLPQYALRARAGDAEWRGETAPRARELRSDSTIELVLSPSHPAVGELEARLFVVGGSTLVRSPVSPEISKDGAVRWIGAAEQVAAGLTGSVTLIAVVGRAGALPETAEEARRPSDAWQSQTLEVSILR